MEETTAEQARFWREIDLFLAQARAKKPIHQTADTLDLGQLLSECAPTLSLTRLATALEGWDGRLLMPIVEESPDPQLQPGDRLVVDPEAMPCAGDLVLAFTGEALLVRTLVNRAGHHWLVAGGTPTIPLGPDVAILGVAVEVQRALSRRAAERNAA